MIRKLLFETRIGDVPLAVFERLTGLAIVPVEELRGEASEPETLTPYVRRAFEELA